MARTSNRMRSLLTYTTTWTRFAHRDCRKKSLSYPFVLLSCVIKCVSMVIPKKSDWSQLMVCHFGVQIKRIIQDHWVFWLIWYFRQSWKVTGFYQQKMPYAMLGCEAHLKINQNAIWKAFKNTLNSQQLHPIFDVSPLCMECLDNHRRKSLEWVVERESWSPVKALCWLAFSNGSPSDTVPSGRIDWDIGQTRLLGFDFQGSPVCLVVVKETISVQQVIGHLMQDRK